MQHARVNVQRRFQPTTIYFIYILFAIFESHPNKSGIAAISSAWVSMLYDKGSLHGFSVRLIVNR